MQRRLPVYLIIDTSESMLGEPSEWLKKAVDTMIATLQYDPNTYDTAYLSIITFDTKARVVRELTEISEYCVAPVLSIHPKSAFGAALDLLCNRLDREVFNKYSNDYLDYRPLVFFITAGAPTDEWKEPLKRFQEKKDKLAKVYAIGCGEDVDFTILTQLADEVIPLNAETETENNLETLFERLFVWISMSVSKTSRSLYEAPLPPPPDIIQIQNAEEAEQREKESLRTCRPKKLFLHRRCSKDGGHYVERLTFDGMRYGSPEAFKVGNDYILEEIASNEIIIPEKELADHAACPYCGADYIFTCKCGTVSCSTGVPPHVCPACQHETEHF